MTARRWLVAVLVTSACLNRSEVVGHSGKLSRSVRSGDIARVRGMMLPAAAASVDAEALVEKPARREWARRLRRPQEVHLEATILIVDGRPARVVKSRGGWHFAQDPTDVYRQDTPEQAVAALVWASRMGRWDVLLRLAPRRYRVGLSQEQLKAAWTDGKGATELARARDRVALHLGEPIFSDAHEGLLELGDGHVLRLEREAGAWVIVDF